MTDPGANRTSFLRQIAEKIGNPLEWSSTNKCTAAAAILFSFLLYQQGAVGYVIEHPEIAPYIDRGWLLRAARVDHALAAAWASIFLAGLWLRKRNPESRALTAAAVQLYAIGACWAAYFTGAYTFPWGTLLILTGGVAGFLLFETRIVLWGCATGLALLIATAAAELMDLIPSAPFFAKAPPPYGTHSFPPTDFFLWAPLFLVAEAFVLGAFAYTISRWRDREEKLAEAKVLLTASNDRLLQATNLIRRYVPSQLAEQILQDGAAPEAYERRVLTIVFSDIKGFTQAAEKLRAENLAALLNDYLSAMSDIVREHGGTLDKFVGDAVMVFFGAPQATSEKDQALRAVRMALKMQERVKSLAEKWKQDGVEAPFAVRIGINTGPVHVGNFGSPDRMDYTVIGHHVNLAARLESNCTPGHVLMSESTRDLVKDEISCTDKGKIQAKGISEAVQVYETSPEGSATRSA